MHFSVRNADSFIVPINLSCNDNVGVHVRWVVWTKLFDSIKRFFYVNLIKFFCKTIAHTRDEDRKF